MTDEKKQLYFLYATATLVIFFSFYLNIWSIPLFDLDEGAFSEATREMFVRNDFISTYLNGEPRFDKPILIYWLQAVSISLFGINEFAFRLPSSLAATAWALAIYFFVKRHIDKETALIATIIMASTFAIPVIGRAATADALLNLWITLTMFLIYEYHLHQRKKTIYAIALFMGLGFLTKGPVALLIPGVVSMLFFALQGQTRILIRAFLNPVAITVFLAVALPWYVLEYLKEGHAFIEGFFFKHNIDRFSNPMESHGGSLFYFIPVVLIGILPYTSTLFKVLKETPKLRKNPLSLYLLIWFFFVFIFFSLSGTKLPHYINYGYSALFILMAVQLQSFQSRLLLLIPPLLFYGLMLALPDIISQVAQNSDDAFLRSTLENSTDYFLPSYYIMVLFALGLTIYLLFENSIAIKNKLLICGVVGSFFMAQFLLPIIGQIKQQPIKEAALIAKENNYNVVMWKLNTPSFNVYSQRLTAKRTPESGDIVLTPAIHAATLGAHQTLYKKNGIALIKLLEHP